MGGRGRQWNWTEGGADLQHRLRGSRKSGLYATGSCRMTFQRHPESGRGGQALTDQCCLFRP